MLRPAGLGVEHSRFGPLGAQQQLRSLAEPSLPVYVG